MDAISIRSVADKLIVASINPVSHGGMEGLRKIMLDRAAELHALATTLAAREDWLPIESAPKDGTPVLVHNPAWVDGVPIIAEWDDMYANWFVHGYGEGINPQPTVYQPLPAAPPAQGTGEGS